MSISAARLRLLSAAAFTATLTAAIAAAQDLPRRGELPFKTKILYHAEQFAEWGTDFGVYTWIETRPNRPGGDWRVLVSINGADIKTREGLNRILRAHKAGDTLRCEFVANHPGHYFEAIKLEPRPLETAEDLDISYGFVRSNGLRLRTIITRPKTSRKLPALLYIERDGRFQIDFPHWPNGVYRSFLEGISRAGFVVMRVARPGSGDSEGESFRDCSFESNLDGFRQALNQLKSLNFVDPDKVFVIGRYTGGILAAKLAAETKLAGIVTYGTGLRVTHSRNFGSARGSWLRNYREYPDARRLIEGEHVFLDELLRQGRSPEQIRKRHPDLERHVEHFLENPLELYDRNIDYLKALYAIDMDEMWKNTRTPLLVLWGKTDWANSHANPRGIVQRVNANSPGRAKLIEFTGTDNEFTFNSTAETTFTRTRDFHYNEAIAELIIAWLQEQTCR